MIARGAKAKTTEITDSFSFDDYRDKYPDRLVLFVVSAGGSVKFPLEASEIAVPAGSRVCALVPADKQA